MEDGHSACELMEGWEGVWAVSMSFVMLAMFPACHKGDTSKYSHTIRLQFRSRARPCLPRVLDESFPGFGRVCYQNLLSYPVGQPLKLFLLADVPTWPLPWLPPPLDGTKIQDRKVLTLRPHDNPGFGAPNPDKTLPTPPVVNIHPRCPIPRA